MALSLPPLTILHCGRGRAPHTAWYPLGRHSRSALSNPLACRRGGGVAPATVRTDRPADLAYWLGRQHARSPPGRTTCRQPLLHLPLRHSYPFVSTVGRVCSVRRTNQVFRPTA